MHIDIEKVAERCNGYVAADLVSLVYDAETAAEARGAANVTTEDFFAAMCNIVPSALRPTAITSGLGDGWSSVGGIDAVKRSVQRAVEWPQKFKGAFEHFGIVPPRGVLLYGPPGCSKTSIVRAVAASSKRSFISISMADIYSPYVGQAERAIRRAFASARAALPSILFMDEIDATVCKRGEGASGSGGDAVQERVLSTLLNEMDGVQSAGDLLCIGATNRPDLIDDALLRPGRFSEVIYCPPPNAASRLEIFRIHTKDMRLAHVDLAQLASISEGYTGADIAGICTEAALNSLRSNHNADFVRQCDFECAMQSTTPTLDKGMLEVYELFRNKNKGN